MPILTQQEQAVRHGMQSAGHRHAEDLARACQVLNARIEARSPEAIAAATLILDTEARRLRAEQEQQLREEIAAEQRRARRRRSLTPYVILALTAVACILLIAGAR